MKVLVVLEDPTHDQYVAKPVIERIFREVGRRARIEVLVDPYLRGIDDLFARINEIIEDNQMIDMFLVIVDRDCNRTNNTVRLNERLVGHGQAIGCLAVEEIEVWMLAVQDNLPALFGEIRTDCDPKERFAEPFLAAAGLSRGVGRGRKRAMEKLARNYRRLRDRCTEVFELEREIRSQVAP